MFTLSQPQPKFVHETSFKGLLFQCPASFKGRQFQRTNYKREGSKSSQKETKKIKENVQYPNVYIKK